VALPGGTPQVGGACRAGAGHLVQGRGSLAGSEDWPVRRDGFLRWLVCWTPGRSPNCPRRDGLPAEPARSPWLRPDRRVLLREREHVDPARSPGRHRSRRSWPSREPAPLGALALLGRCRAGAVTSSRTFSPAAWSAGPAAAAAAPPAISHGADRVSSADRCPQPASWVLGPCWYEMVRKFIPRLNPSGYDEPPPTA
jgi:hypothetical protein